MKKLILTFSVIALFSVAAKAQDKTTTTKKDNSTTTTKHAETAPNSTGVNSAGVNPDGTAATPEPVTAPATAAEKKESAAPKKSGTRMAINEKGVPGGSSSKKDAPKEEKTNSPK